MNNLLIFFAIPLATIILSAIFETFINSPIKVAGIFFSIFIVVVFALGETAELIVAAIIYTIISFITAWFIYILLRRTICDNTVSTVSNYVNSNSQVIDTVSSVQDYNFENIIPDISSKNSNNSRC